MDGPMLDFMKSVVPKAVEVDRLSLNDVVQVSAAVVRGIRQGVLTEYTWRKKADMKGGPLTQNENPVDVF